MSTQPKQISNRFSGFKDSIFTKMTQLSIACGAVNLGQGAPDEEPELFIKEAAAKACMGSHHQYQRSQGAVPLVKALSALYSPYLQRDINPMTEIHVGVGATEVGYSSFNTLVNPGDEVVLFEPFFDCYEAWAKVVEAKTKYIPLKHFKQLTNPCITSPTFEKDAILRSDDFTFDKDLLEASITEKTRILLLNTPHNPLGKIFSMSELEFIATLVRKFPNLIVISDEVYDFLTHSDTGIEYSVRNMTPLNGVVSETPKQAPMSRFATLPDMWDRTLTISSCGKSFNITGWKIGWAIGPANLIAPLSVGHQWISFSLAAPLQHALADVIEQAQTNGYFERLGKHYTFKRDLLYKGLYEAGLNPILSSAGYFIVCDGEKLIPRLGMNREEIGENDLGEVFAEELAKKVGVTSIPVGCFYSAEHKTLGNTLLRFAYCKKVEMIEQAMKVLQDWNQQQKQ